jgi:hypothetical protein
VTHFYLSWFEQRCSSGSAYGDAAARCGDGFLAAATVPAAMLIKNRFHHMAAQ